MPHPDDDLRTASNRAWQALVEYYRSFPKGVAEKNASGHLKYDWKKHERRLLRCLQPLLKTLVCHIRENSRLSLGYGIVHINSPLAGRRLKLPIWGHRLATQSSFWRKYVMDSNSRALMFRQPSSPTHLLTELMWRLQPSSEAGNGFALALFLTRHDPLFDILGKSGFALAFTEKSLDFFRAPDKPWRAPRSKTEAISLLGQDNNSLFHDRIAPLLNRRLTEVGSKAAVPLDLSYTDAQVQSLTSPALETLLKMGKQPFPESEVPINIFYLPDIIETDEVGGLDFQVLPQPGRDPSPEEMHDFLLNVQWFFSQYVLHPLVAAERNHALEGPTYRESHFSFAGAGADPSSGGLADIIDRLKDAQARTAGVVAKETVGVVLKHFHVARSSSGDYWRGYQRHAFETACTVAAVFDSLFSRDEGAVLLEPLVRSCGSRFDGLHNAPVTEMVRQLFRGLAAENELFLTPFYREHFVHSFHCFALGLVLLGWPNDNLLPDSLRNSFADKKDEAKTTRLLQEWFLVSMWHDVAYSLQKGHELLEGFVTGFLDTKKRGKRCRGLLPWRPSLGHLLQARSMLDPLRKIAHSAFHVSDTLSRHLGVGAADIALATALDRADHGIWSALFFGHVCDSAQLLREYGIRHHDIMRAIFVHHLQDWGLKSVLSDFDLDEAVMRRATGEDKLTVPQFTERIGKGDGSYVYVDPEANPLGFLLFLSDMLSQPGRESPEMGGRAPSRIGIRLEALRLGSHANLNERGALIVSLRYAHSPVLEKDLKDRFFGNPAKFFLLGCNSNTRTSEARRLCVQILKGEEPTSETWITFGGRLPRGAQ